MTAQISFLAGESATIQHLLSSGLGFYSSSGFGTSVAVGSFPGSVFITDANGTVNGPPCDNVAWAHANSGISNGAGPYDLTHVPNQLATLNIRFTNDTAVLTQNAELRIYDRANINNNPSGVTCYVAELIHPNTSVSAGGSGSSQWTNCFGSGSILSLTDSPSNSGFSPLGSNSSDTNHDFYVCLSPSVDSIGSKLFAAYFSVEYL